jgi:hypothetical protein
MELHEVVMKLVGPVQPVGESGTDAVRLKNMQALTDLVDMLLGEISKAEPDADRHEASMRLIGQHARDFLQDVKDAD